MPHLHNGFSICNDSEQSLDVLDGGDWSKSKEDFDVFGHLWVEGESGKTHDGPLGVADVEQLVLPCHFHHVVDHGPEVLLRVLVKSTERIAIIATGILSLTYEKFQNSLESTLSVV